jgi:phage/plasmid primase-like uncharacterized protein
MRCNTKYSTVKQAATGRWPEILQYLGIPGESLTGKHTLCPGCGGKDRFRWDAGKEAFFCGQGGSTTGGDGFSLLEHCGWTKADALYAVAQHLHVEKVMLSAERLQKIKHHKQQAHFADLDDGIYHECHILMQTTAGRKNSRDLEHDRKFREVRPDWMPYKKEVWDRELIAAKRLTKMLEARYGV